MAEIEFKYSANQPHQIEAVESTISLFNGQRFGGSDFSITAADNMYSLAGHANSRLITENQLKENLHTIQEENGLPRTEVLTDGRLRDFTIEMETGTGKTYIYIRTIYELNKLYGLTKFIVVVPSVAIRESVMKSFQSTKKHFDELYDHAPIDVFVYDSKDMGPVGNFATSSSIQVMIINIGAFNKELDKDAKKGTINIFHRTSEKLVGGQSPRELITECNPIVIIDEPQSVDNTAKAKKAVASLNPLFVLRYSATHREPYNMIYRLTPVDAFQQNLVKGIVVDSVLTPEDINGAYIKLDSTSTDPYRAKLIIDVRQKNGIQKRKAVTVKVGDNLYLKSKENSDYDAGWIVTNIGTAEGDEFIQFDNDEYLELGEAIGDVASDKIKIAQIRQTIEDHLEKQLKLWPKIKVLSLFFIDRVERYRVYDENGAHLGDYARIFEQEYRSLVESKMWQQRYKNANVPLPLDPHPLHQGYFSCDGRGRFKDTSTAASTAADISTFELIMRDKESLVSFPDGSSAEEDAKRSVSFIFSHSALKEGWDNPNIFQICTLVETKDTLTKRQKIGRGLRLSVDQSGARTHDPQINELTVIANESYDSFASDLQKELESEGFRFGVISRETFTNVVVEHPSGVEGFLGFEGSETIYNLLVEKGLIGDDGAITSDLKEHAEKHEVPLPDEFESGRDQIEKIILRRAEKVLIKDKKREVQIKLKKDVSNSPAFQELWDRIRQRTRFELNVDTEKLIKLAVEGIQNMPKVKPLEIRRYRGKLDVGESGVVTEKAGDAIVSTGIQTVYDLPDPIAELQDAVGLTRKTLKSILEKCERVDEFAIDPATFLSQVATKINKAKLEIVAEGIKYTKLPENEWYRMEVLVPEDVKAYLDQNAWQPQNNKSLYNYVVYDSSTVEKPFAVELDQAEEVKVFAKLPSKFTIDTPVGAYNPDWAYVEEKDGEQRIYFVVETKGGGNGDPALRTPEQAKIRCAGEHFKALDLSSFEYEVMTTYH